MRRNAIGTIRKSGREYINAYMHKKQSVHIHTNMPGRMVWSILALIYPQEWYRLYTRHYTRKNVWSMLMSDT
jgi:hypothetical protein